MTVRSVLKGSKANPARGAHWFLRESVVQSYLTPAVNEARRTGDQRSSAQPVNSCAARDSNGEPVKVVDENNSSDSSPVKIIWLPRRTESKAERATPPPNPSW